MHGFEACPALVGEAASEVGPRDERLAVACLAVHLEGGEAKALQVLGNAAGVERHLDGVAGTSVCKPELQIVVGEYAAAGTAQCDAGVGELPEPCPAITFLQMLCSDTYLCFHDE